MQVYVVPAIGGGGTDKIQVEVQETDTVGALKKKVCQMKNLQEAVTRLTYEGKAINDSQVLRDLGVKPGQRFVLITQTIGGTYQS